MQFNYICTKCRRRTVREDFMFPYEAKCEYCGAPIVPIKKDF